MYYNVGGITYSQNLVSSNYPNMCFVEEPNTDVNLIVNVSTSKNGVHLKTVVYPYIFGVNIDSKSLLPDNPEYFRNRKGEGIICNEDGLTINSWITEDNPTLVLTRNQLASVNVARNADTAHKSIALYVFGEKVNNNYIIKGGFGTRGGNATERGGLGVGMGNSSGNSYISVDFEHDGLMGGSFFIGFMPKQSQPQADATSVFSSFPRINV